MLIPLIVVLAIADDVHIMQHWDEERRHKSAEASFKATVAHLAAPLFGASATTALGMASLATSNVVAVRSFGVGSAVGIMVDFMISLVFVPTMLSLMKPELEEPLHEKYLVQPMRRIAAFSTQPSARRPGRHGGARPGRGDRDPGSARRHQPHQLLQRRSPARTVGPRDRRRAVGGLQLPDPAGGTAGVAGHARELFSAWIGSRTSCGSCRT